MIFKTFLDPLGVSRPSAHNDHTYASTSSLSLAKQFPQHPKQGFTTLGMKGATNSVGPLEESSPDIAVGHTIHLSQDGCVIGTATAMGGDQLHGQPVPIGYIRITINEIVPGIRSMVTTTFDDEFLSAGSITAWPIADMRKFWH